MRRPVVLLGILFLLLSVVGSGRIRTENHARYERLVQSLLDAAGVEGAVTVTGTVRTCDAAAEGIRYSINRISLVAKDNSVHFSNQDHTILFTIKDTKKIRDHSEPVSEKTGMADYFPELLPGDQVTVSGTFRSFEQAGNPGQFDAWAYYARRKTLGTLTKPEIRSVSEGRPGILRALCAARRALGRSFLRVMPSSEARTAAAITLGEKSWMDEAVRTLYQETGVAHIASVSGLHISMAGMTLYRMLRSACLGIWGSALVSAAAVAGFALMTGAEVPAIRALVMFLFWLGAQLTGRKYDSKTAVCCVLAGFLAADPTFWEDSSFLLSFSAALVLSFFLPALRTAFPRGKGALSRVAASVCSGAGLWLGMLPATLYCFYQVTPSGILANLLVIPMLPAIMVFGLAGACAGLFCVPAGIFLAAPAQYLLKAVTLIGEAQLWLPGAVVVRGRPTAAALLLYLLLLITAAGGTVLLRKKKKALLLLWAGCACFGWLAVSPAPLREAEVICMDVGQGDGALLRFPSGEHILIDGGSSTDREVWKRRISQTLRYCGADTIDYLFVSHADGDHISGIRQFLEEYEPGLDGKNRHGITAGALVLPPASDDAAFDGLIRLAQGKGIRVLRMKKGDVLCGGKEAEKPKETGVLQWSLECLSPSQEELTGNQNEDSMVLMLRYGAFCMLFTGDLEGEAEERLAKSGSLLDAQVLKVGHHGSAGGSSVRFLEAVTPQVAVISCAKENRYGHPAPETVERLTEAGSIICTTADCGAVTIRTDGRRFRVTTARPSK